ncbi:MAG TPA: hypothetical protein VGL62_13085 [Vicinamibacterales bacterium]|jgi:hypothetical protein
MRKDMAEVVTEAPRRGHSNPSCKWGRRLTRDEYALDDHGASRAPVSRHRQYGWNAKEFSDSLGPLRGYLRKQVGRPWDKVWSEIATTLDSRSLTGQHIFDHLRWEVELDAWLGDDGRLYQKRRWGTIELVTGLYVHPRAGLLSRGATEGPQEGAGATRPGARRTRDEVHQREGHHGEGGDHQAYVREAIAVEKAGLRMKPKKTSDFPVPAELKERFRSDLRFSAPSRR